jgi:hypothetical protein
MAGAKCALLCFRHYTLTVTLNILRVLLALLLLQLINCKRREVEEFSVLKSDRTGIKLFLARNPWRIAF